MFASCVPWEAVLTVAGVALAVVADVTPVFARLSLVPPPDEPVTVVLAQLTDGSVRHVAPEAGCAVKPAPAT